MWSLKEQEKDDMLADLGRCVVFCHQSRINKAAAGITKNVLSKEIGFMRIALQNFDHLLAEVQF